MAKKLSISDSLIHTTVRIECLNSGNLTTGTGFFFRVFDEEGIHIPTIVTNKHLLSGASSARIQITLADSHGNPQLGSHKVIVIEEPDEVVVFHPNESVDLCMIPFAGAHLQVKEMYGQKFYYKALAKSLIPSEQDLAEMTAIEPIVMIGYPIGLWDSTNNLPIIRSGFTATHPAIDYNGKPEFMIDAACFAGSSGSPVFLLNTTGFATRSMFDFAKSMRLLGVLYSGPVQTVAGEIEVVEIPTSAKARAVSQLPINLGLVIKSSQLLDFVPIFAEKARSESPSQIHTI